MGQLKTDNSRSKVDMDEFMIKVENMLLVPDDLKGDNSSHKMLPKSHRRAHKIEFSEVNLAQNTMNEVLDTEEAGVGLTFSDKVQHQKNINMDSSNSVN